MPAISVTQSQFERFQKFAEPFVDSHESAFEKVLKLAEGVEFHAPPSTSAPFTFGITNLPDLKHTSIVAISVNSKRIDTNYWNSALIEVLRAAKGKCSLSEAAQTLPVNITTEKKTVHGYKWHQDLGVSVQGLAATEAAKTMLSFGEKYGIKIEIEFFWQNKPEAANPGQKAKLIAG